MKNKIKVISVVGPTASGKTGLSVELAKLLDGEIISADSMQIYKGMDIATAKPDDAEMQGEEISFRSLSAAPGFMSTPCSTISGSTMKSETKRFQLSFGNAFKKRE